MIWDKDISFEGFHNHVEDWYSNGDHFLGDPPITAQYALDLIFRTLIDDKEHYPYLTTMPESQKQINSLMLEVILSKYSHRYRMFKKQRRRRRS